MDLLKYLEPMKNLPERFSNLAFWRGVRKLRDEVVNAFEYVDSWGESVEHDISSLQNVKISTYHGPILDDSIPNFLQKLTLVFDTADHTCSLSLYGFTVSKKPNQIIIPLGITFNIITGDTSIGDNVSLPFTWSPISTSSPTSIEFGYIQTIVVPCYGNYQPPFRGKNFYVYGYVLEYPE
jgi:hypothetical protein